MWDRCKQRVVESLKSSNEFVQLRILGSDRSPLLSRLFCFYQEGGIFWLLLMQYFVLMVLVLKASCWIVLYFLFCFSFFWPCPKNFQALPQGDSQDAIYIRYYDHWFLGSSSGKIYNVGVSWEAITVSYFHYIHYKTVHLFPCEFEIVRGCGAWGKVLARARSSSWTCSPYRLRV